MKTTKQRWSSLWLVSVMCVAATPRAEAQDNARRRASVQDPTDAEARARFKAGRLAFEAERFEDALRDFLRAYELSGRPALLYNVGTTYLRLSQPERALAYFEQYLTELPHAENRADAEAHIAELQALLAARAEEDSAEPVSADTPEQAPPDPKATAARSSAWPFLWMGAGGALVASGSVLLGLALRAKAQVENPPDDARWSEIEADYERVKPWSVAGGVMLGAGAAALATGLYLRFAGVPREPRSVVLLHPRGLAVRRQF